MTTGPADAPTRLAADAPRRARLVVHLTSADTPPHRLEVLARLRASATPDTEHRAIHLGRGPAPSAAGHARVATLPLGLPSLASSRLAAVLGPTRPDVFIAWSPLAISPAINTASYRRTDEYNAVLFDADLAHDPARLARWYQAAPGICPVAALCPNAHTLLRMLQHGIPRGHCVLIRDAVDYAALRNADRAAVRAQLRAADKPILLVLPPVTRDSGTLEAAWAALIAEKVIPGLTVVIPGRSDAVDRVRRLVESARHTAVARFPGDRFSLAQLVTAADAAIFTPVRDAPTHALAWAMAAGTPVIGSAIPAVAELVAHAHSGWLARAGDIKDIAARIVQLFENREQAQRIAQVVRLAVFKAFSAQRQTEQFNRLLDNIAAGRPFSDGIDDPALNV